MKRCEKLIKSRLLVVLFMLSFGHFTVFAQQNVTFTGTVHDTDGVPVYGATVMYESDVPVGVMTNEDGTFTIKAPNNSELSFSMLGMKTVTLTAVKGKALKVILDYDNALLEEVIVVGYGQQKKASVVGAIVQTSAAVLERSPGVADLGTALTGNLPGVVTTASSGMPGEEDPQITIRGTSSWNGNSPLVLVDGIERPMNSVDVASVESISVLKDASATAVYGVKGANGVILITTKRGAEGKAVINVSANSTFKSPSYLPSKYDSYGALSLRNVAIEHELSQFPGSWAYMTPEDILLKYKNPANAAEAARYPNVDWQDVMFKDFAMAYNAHLDVRGGNDKIKYYVSGDYQHEGDLFESWDNSRDYSTAYTFNRINMRSNLDYQMTPTTKFSMNLSGSAGTRRTPWEYSGGENNWEEAQRWAGAYGTPPDAFLPMYEDGSFGFYPISTMIRNPIKALATTGDKLTTNINITTDFILQQDLKFITKGLSLRAMISWDNVFTESERGLKDQYNAPQESWINPATGDVTYYKNYDPGTGFEFNAGKNWSTSGGGISGVSRRLYYQGQLNYNRSFGKHNVGAMGLFSRNEYAWGSMIPSFREDWVFRTTYNYGEKYFIEYNGAYNGSEKFSAENRFAFFSSGAIGWTISNENFMKDVEFIDLLKLRASYGEIGDDNTNGRWLFMNEWSYGGSTTFEPGEWGQDMNTPYTWYSESKIGNPNVHWETVTKTNYGVDFAIFDSFVSGSFDYFADYRDEILVNGWERAEPVYFGATPPTLNLGIMKTHGYEFELKFQKKINYNLNLWANVNMTHAINEVVKKTDPEFKPSYQKEEGFILGQNRNYIDKGFLESYDQIYGSPSHDVLDLNRQPGDYYIIDYNADGIVDTDDSVPYACTSSPQNSYNATLGGSYKGFSFFVQLYGVTNVVRDVYLKSFEFGSSNVYDLGTWWAVDHDNAKVTTPNYLNDKSQYSQGTQYIFDASYIRLKNVELAYNFSSKSVKKIGLKSLKLYVNGNNLWIWSRMPDDRESNFSGGGSTGAYPTMRRINLGIKLTL